MRQVWKYLISIYDHNQSIRMPTGAKLIHIGQQGRKVGLWFEVDPREKHYIIRHFRVFGTEHPIESGEHIGTVIITPYVLHVYEIQREN